VKLVHVPYRTSQFPDLVSGQVQVTFNPLPSSLGFIKNGQLRALAVTSKERQAVLPNVPTIGESVPGYEGTAWFGLGVPQKTPKDVVATLNKAMNAGLADAKFKAKLIELGGVPMPGSPQEFSKFIHEENAKWAKVVKFSGAKVD
jgi:tripartite-type tricarboxylate transporter receptor subunit TctC